MDVYLILNEYTACLMMNYCRCRPSLNDSTVPPNTLLLLQWNKATPSVATEAGKGGGSG